MSIVTIIILVAVIWQIVLKPFREGFKGSPSKGQINPKEYTDYEEIK